MGESTGPAAGAKPKGKPAPAAKAEDTPARSWVVPITTVLLLASAFCFYYFIYVGARRQYLVNRNFRALAAMGDHLQRILSTHGSILEFYADLAAHRAGEQDRSKADLSKFLVTRPEDRELKAGARTVETRKDYLHYLAPTFELTEESLGAKGQMAAPRARMDVQRRDGRWQLVLSAFRHPGTEKDYLGTLEIGELMKVPPDSMPFDDLLLVSEHGTVVYQDKKAGPQFTTLASLLKAQDKGAESKGADPSKVAESPWQGGAIHLTDVMLAGTRYKLFVQPILLDIYSDEPTRTEPTREWVLCGLRASSELEWEALSISYNAIIGFTALFFAICMGGPILKVLFINPRERFRLRELAFLALFLVLLAGVFTLTALQAVHFRLNGDTDAELLSLSAALSDNIHDDLKGMREQLQEWCQSGELAADLSAAAKTEVVRNTPDAARGQVSSSAAPPVPTKYHFTNNAYWTDDDGRQIVKWSTSGFVTPMIDISRQEIYTAPRRTYLDGARPPFHFGSALPPNKFQYLAVLAVDTTECNARLDLNGNGIRGDVLHGAAFITGQPFSLLDPILPYGYGFALVDEAGLVLFHSDKTKNGRENFREESDWSKELYAGMFGHSTQRSLRINYLGRQCRAVMVPVRGVTQAPWSLIVYTDLTAERTLALETMTMAATLLLAVLAAPGLLVAVWCLVRRPRFAPEWIWPNQERIANYLYQIGVYTLLIAVFLWLGFQGPIEQIVVACAAVPYCALLLTVWCFRRYTSPAERARARKEGHSAAAPAALTVLSGAVFFWVVAIHWPHLKALALLPVVAAMAAVPLLDRPRRYFSVRLRYRRRAQCAEPKPATGKRLDYTHYYAASVLLLLLLMGVLMPMALFRGCLDVERRLGIKRAQLHLAAAVAERWGTVQDNWQNEEMGPGACMELKERNSPAWRKIVPRPVPFGERELEIVAHDETVVPGNERLSKELYEGWFRRLVYMLHHDYNSTAAEALGVIGDRVRERRDGALPDWSWADSVDKVTLRWHGVHPPAGESEDRESDLLIGSEMPAAPWRNAASGFGIAVAVMLVMGSFLWMLVRKVFLIHLAPLKITGVRELAEAVREGRNVLVLVPPRSDFEIEAPAMTLDVRVLATEAQWAAADGGLPSWGGVVEICHFEHASELATPERKAELLRRFGERESAQVAAIMEVPASTEDHRRQFPQLAVIDLRDEPLLWLKQYEGPAQDLIWKECRPMPALWPLGAQLAIDIRNDSGVSDDTIASEMLERADPYYRMVWRECSNEQKFALSQLAEDGLVNPMNGRAIRQLMRRGLIERDPGFRIMNESFRRFLRSATTADLKMNWAWESRRSGWGKLQGAFFTTMIVVGVFLLTTQNALWQSSAAYVTTAFGGLGTLAKLFNTYRGSVGGEKDG